MTKHQNSTSWIGAAFLLLILACTTDPIPGPRALLPPVPPVPPILDPGPADPCQGEEISFYHQVLPIMVASCAFVGCHDAETAAEGVVLDTYDNIRRQVRPGRPGDSDLYESVLPGSDDFMPPPPAPAARRAAARA